MSHARTGYNRRLTLTSGAIAALVTLIPAALCAQAVQPEMTYFCNAGLRGQARGGPLVLTPLFVGKAKFFDSMERDLIEKAFTRAIKARYDNVASTLCWPYKTPEVAEAARQRKRDFAIGQGRGVFDFAWSPSGTGPGSATSAQPPQSAATAPQRRAPSPQPVATAPQRRAPMTRVAAAAENARLKSLRLLDAERARRRAESLEIERAIAGVTSFDEKMRISGRIRREQLARRPGASRCPKAGCRGSKQ